MYNIHCIYIYVCINIYIFVNIFIYIYIYSFYSAIRSGHIEPLLPFVSDAGTNAPQAGFFAQTLDIIAILSTNHK